MHDHECRDCGDGFDCDGPDHWNGCAEFNGTCPDCTPVIVVAHEIEAGDEINTADGRSPVVQIETNAGVYYFHCANGETVGIYNGDGNGTLQRYRNAPRWMVVDRARRPVSVGLYVRKNADSIAAEYASWGDEGPYRVVSDTVAETVN